MKVDILGSCVSRDIFRYARGKKIEIERFICDVPISGLYEGILLINQERLDKVRASQVEKRMLQIQGKRVAIDYLKKSEGNILIIDLASELYDRGILKSDEKKRPLAIIPGIEQREKIFDEISSPLAISEEIVEKSYRRFAQDIIKTEKNPKGYLEKNIIIVETFFSEKLICVGEGVIKEHDSIYEAAKRNEWLRARYDALYRYIPEAKVIKFPQHVYSQDTNLRSMTPLAYAPENYTYFSRALNTLLGYEKITTPDNLCKEQSLTNKVKVWAIKTAKL